MVVFCLWEYIYGQVVCYCFLLRRDLREVYFFSVLILKYDILEMVSVLTLEMDLRELSFEVLCF
jgi:hypothetical protein